MNILAKLAFATIFAVTASMSQAGGPVVIEEEGNPEVIAEKPASSVGLLPLLLIPVVLCLVMCGGGDDPEEEPEKVPVAN